MDATMPPPDPREEFEFWGRQATEHMLFLHLGIEDVLIKAEAMRQHDRLARAYEVRDLNAFVALLRVAIATKQRVLDRLNAGQWLGWIYPLFVDHVLREERYFLARLAGADAPAEEAKRWARFMAEHAAFAAHLIDPSETKWVATTTRFGEVLSEDADACARACTAQLVEMTARNTAELNAVVGEMKPGRPASIIHPVLAAHVLREGERGARFLSDAAGALGP